MDCNSYMSIYIKTSSFHLTIFFENNVFVFLQAATSASMTSASAKDDSQTADNDRKRRAQAAAERKAKVMAQMNQMQKKFAKTHQSELASMETDVSANAGASASTALDPNKKNRYKAVGAEKSMPQVRTYIKITHIRYISF